MSNKRFMKDEKVIDTENQEPPTEIMTGLVTNCVKLNIRKEANKEADVVCVVDALTKLIIDPNNSTDEWFSVCTETGVAGFCMRDFVTVDR